MNVDWDSTRWKVSLPKFCHSHELTSSIKSYIQLFTFNVVYWNFFLSCYRGMFSPNCLPEISCPTFHSNQSQAIPRSTLHFGARRTSQCSSDTISPLTKTAQWILFVLRVPLTLWMAYFPLQCGLCLLRQLLPTLLQPCWASSNSLGHCASLSAGILQRLFPLPESPFTQIQFLLAFQEPFQTPCPQEDFPDSTPSRLSCVSSGLPQSLASVYSAFTKLFK